MRNDPKPNAAGSLLRAKLNHDGSSSPVARTLLQWERKGPEAIIMKVNDRKGGVMVKMYSLMICGLILLALSNCTDIVGKTYGVAVDQRSAGTILSDEEIKLTIEKRLVEENATDFVDISTFSYDGHVYLVGEYGTRKERKRALEIARRAPGVKSVTIYLLPKGEKGACGWAEDVQVAGELRVGVIGDKDIHSTNIDDKVIHCHVVLLGIVGSKEEIAKAVADARSVTGVRDVTSYLKVAD